jgi:hypothetical protein
MNDITECLYAEGFKFWEKLYAQISFNVMAIVGIIGIAIVDWPWAVPYAFLYLYGIPFIVMRHLTCPRCPHLNTHGDCLQFPPNLTKRLIKRGKATPFHPVEKFLFYSIFILLPLYPIYWLLNNQVLVIVFVVAAGVWYVGQLFYFCKHCRVGACPFNRTPLRRS